MPTIQIAYLHSDLMQTFLFNFRSFIIILDMFLSTVGNMCCVLSQQPDLNIYFYDLLSPIKSNAFINAESLG